MKYIATLFLIVFDSDRYREDADQKFWKRFIEFLEEAGQ